MAERALENVGILRPLQALELNPASNSGSLNWTPWRDRGLEMVGECPPMR